MVITMALSVCHLMMGTFSIKKKNCCAASMLVWVIKWWWLKFQTNFTLVLSKIKLFPEIWGEGIYLIQFGPNASGCVTGCTGECGCYLFSPVNIWKFLSFYQGDTAGAFSRITGSLGQAVATLTFDSKFQMVRLVFIQTFVSSIHEQPSIRYADM